MQQTYTIAVVYSPAMSTEPDKYMAEIPALPGCRAWGDSVEEVLEIIADLAKDFLPSSSDQDVDWQRFEIEMQANGSASLRLHV